MVIVRETFTRLRASLTPPTGAKVVSEDVYVALERALAQVQINLEKCAAEWKAMIDTLHLHAQRREGMTPAQRRRAAKREIREWKYIAEIAGG